MCVCVLRGADTLSDPNSSHYSGNPNCWQVSSCRGQIKGGSTDTDGDVRDTTNGLWHQLVVTTHPDGSEGYSVYVDGVLRANDPFIQGVGINRVDTSGGPGTWQTTGGRPTDPVGPIRLCGRAKPGAWVGDTAPVIWDPRRYFLGKVAHFSVWDQSFTADQVVALHNAYVSTFNLPTTPFLMPAGIQRPLAYYYLDEGHGWNLRDTIAGNSTAGEVTYEDTSSHPENANYTEPNWRDDDIFGSAIQCGRADTWQKDTLSLADVDYGHSGRWAMSVWFRHDPENFPGYSREQFIGHGDPIRPTSSNNQFHVQMERSNKFLTIMRDSTDIDRYTLSDPNSSHYSGDPNCWQVSRAAAR